MKKAFCLSSHGGTPTNRPPPIFYISLKYVRYFVAAFDEKHFLSFLKFSFLQFLESRVSTDPPLIPFKDII